jgi:hypothetical protein
MNELLRLHYLDAMGITQYVARTPLPGAHPSPLITLERPQQKNAARESLLLENISTEKPAVTAKRSSLQTQQAPVGKSQPTHSDIFQCQLAIWIVEDLLVLAEAPRLDNTQLSLLRNILQAIGRKTDLPPVRQFSWPIPQRKDRSLQAAREHFQGLLDGGLLKRHPDQKMPVRQIILFGKHIPALLQATEADSTDASFNYHDWPVIVVSSLHEMLQQPALKRDVWKALQVLLRA